MKKRGYSFRNHTADVELVAHGKTIGGAFKNAMLAMFETSADISALGKAKSAGRVLKINDSAGSLGDLLWVTLQDTLSLADSNRVYGYKVDKMEITGKEGSYKVHSGFRAREQDPKYSIIYVKGVSRYRLKVVKKGKEFRISAVLDV